MPLDENDLFTAIEDSVSTLKKIRENKELDYSEKLKKYFEITCYISNIARPEGLSIFRKFIIEINTPEYQSEAILLRLFSLLKSEKLFRENSDEEYGTEGLDYIKLDSSWKSRIRSYIKIIRDEIDNSDLDQEIKAKIHSKISDFEKSLDKNKTNLKKLGEIYLYVTLTTGEGAKNLTPVIGLLTKTVKAIGNLSRSIIQMPGADLFLPPPEEDKDASENNSDEE